MISADAIADVLGGRSVLRRKVSSLSDLREIVAEGLPKQSLRHTVSTIAPAPSEASRMIFAIIPAATFKRRTRLKRPESERTERLARVIATARHVLETADNVKLFMLSPHQLLKNQRPYDVAQTELGARQVEDILWDVFHGLPI